MMTLALMTPPIGSNSVFNHSSSTLQDSLPTKMVAGSPLDSVLAFLDSVAFFGLTLLGRSVLLLGLFLLR